jgi:hypothetical protein
MSFREKSAWITLVTVLACFGIYFGAIVTGRVSGHGFSSLHLMLICVIALVLLQAVLGRVAVATTPKADRGLRDERETLILWRSRSLGYYVLIVLVIGLFIPVHLRHSVFDLANFVLLDVVVATLVVAVAQIVMFRRGA